MKVIAVVIGNNNYYDPYKFNNAVNDAKSMADVFNRLGYTVLSGYDCDNKRYEDLLRHLETELPQYDASVFFYAGHGFQEDGENFLPSIECQVGEADLISPFYFLPLSPGLWILWIMYYIVSYNTFSNTLGESFFNTKVVAAFRIFFVPLQSNSKLQRQTDELSINGNDRRCCHEYDGDGAAEESDGEALGAWPSVRFGQSAVSAA
jgi:hypothetical protein